MIDLNSSSMLSDRINGYLDVGLTRKTEKPRDYLGGSRLGAECERALQYEFFHAPKDDGKTFSGRTLRIFGRGHWVESAMIGWLRQAGFRLEDQGLQSGFSLLDGNIQGHCDGILTGGPEEFGPWPRLWECKGLGEKGFKGLIKNKLAKEYPVYFAQIQIYMKHLEVDRNPALFSAINMNDMDIYWEDIPFDSTTADLLDAKGKRIIEACQHGELLPRAWNDPSYFKCKWCDWSGRCHA